jgi:hypothetical protein
VPDDDGTIGGVLCVITEDTDRIVGERQLTLLHDELERLAVALRDTEARRQESHTRYLEDRSG